VRLFVVPAGMRSLPTVFSYGPNAALVGGRALVCNTREVLVGWRALAQRGKACRLVVAISIR